VNLVYWLVVVALLVLAFLMIIPPLWRKSEIKDADSDKRNVDIAKERAKELKLQFSNGGLTQSQFDEQYAELELSLSDDLDIPMDSQNTLTQGRWVIPVILIFVPVFSVLTYLILGEPNALARAQMQQTQQAKNAPVDVNAMVAKLEKRMQQEPDNAEGWLMLGRSYKYLKQYQSAVNALEKAYALVGDKPEVLLQYADAIAMANGGSLEGKAATLIYKALEISPNDVTGLWLAGMAKAEMSEFEQSLTYWRKLERLLAPNSDSLRELKGLMAQVQARIGGVTVEQPAATNAPVSIEVKVELPESIRAKVSPQDTVFIYAKALTGPPMPLAIVRKQVSDLPLTVRLDDKMAMMPTMKLSNFKQLKVMARISKSGAAMRQKGDFVGFVELTEVSASMSVHIVINKEI